MLTTLPRPNFQWNFDATGLTADQVIQAVNQALRAIAIFTQRTGSVFHSLRRKGDKLRLYCRVAAKPAARNIIRHGGSAFSELPPQADYSAWQDDTKAAATVPSVKPEPTITDEEAEKRKAFGAKMAAARAAKKAAQ